LSLSSSSPWLHWPNPVPADSAHSVYSHNMMYKSCPEYLKIEKTGIEDTNNNLPITLKADQYKLFIN
jgi:hypothetical protein